MGEWNLIIVSVQIIVFFTFRYYVNVRTCILHRVYTDLIEIYVVSL